MGLGSAGAGVFVGIFVSALGHALVGWRLSVLEGAVQPLAAVAASVRELREAIAQVDCGLSRECSSKLEASVAAHYDLRLNLCFGVAGLGWLFAIFLAYRSWPRETPYTAPRAPAKQIRNAVPAIDLDALDLEHYVPRSR